jgi:hypothetical protein
MLRRLQLGEDRPQLPNARRQRVAIGRDRLAEQLGQCGFVGVV